MAKQQDTLIGLSTTRGPLISMSNNDNNIYFYGNVVLPRGAASNLAFRFQQNPSVGMFSPNSNQLSFATSNAEVIRITSDGNVGIKTTAPSYPLHVNGIIYASDDIIAFSDIRMKNNLITIDNALDKVRQLTGYTYNKTNIETQKRYAGLIAQDVQKVLPEVVYEDPNDAYLRLAYPNIVALLVNAIKELEVKVDTLKSI